MPSSSDGTEWKILKFQQIMTFWKNVLFLAFTSVGEIFEVLNFCILNAKYYIHNKRLLDDNIEFLHFLYVLKFKLNIEHKICKMNNTTQTFLNLYSYVTKCDTNILLMK